MTDMFVAMSRSLQAWAADVGLTKHVYKLGVATEDADAAVAALNESGFAGRADWKLVRKQSVEATDEPQVLARVGGREMAVDPVYYPQIKGGKGIFKVKIANVENHVLVRRALAGEQTRQPSIKPVDVADYLIRSAIG
ncbi:MAG: hypothetical protein JNM75_10040 [Rhodospirillales bacterium]|nr:hypothetical protein [Rhodospirillales bacterium]